MLEKLKIEECKEIFSGSNVNRITEALKENSIDFDEKYKYICERFEYIPFKFTKLKNKKEVDENPQKANESFCCEVDGSSLKGDSTVYTPKELLDIYIGVWSNIIEYNIVDISKRRGPKPTVEGPHYKYNWKWKENSNIRGDVSGDVIISFPKFSLPNTVDQKWIKLFARLVYTIGNFMPVPKQGSKCSLNIIHGHHQKGKDFNYERIDCFLLDIKKIEESNYRLKYKSLLGEDISLKKICDLLYLDVFIENESIIDLSENERKSCNTKAELKLLTYENLENYIINSCACIIARGNQLIKILEEKTKNNTNHYTIGTPHEQKQPKNHDN